MFYVQGQPDTNFTVSPDDIREGEIATFQCVATSTTVPDTHNLTIQISSLVNGNAVETKGRFCVLPNKLIINSVRREDKDLKATCKAEETMGLATLINMTVPVNCKSVVYMAPSPFAFHSSFINYTSA